MLLSLQRFSVKNFISPFLLLTILLGVTRPANGVVAFGENEINPCITVFGDSPEELNSKKQFGEEFREIKVTRRRRLSLTKEWHFVFGAERIFNLAHDEGRSQKVGSLPSYYYTLGRFEFLHRYTPF